MKAIRAPWVVLVILLWVSSRDGGLFVFSSVPWLIKGRGPPPEIRALPVR